MLLAPVRPPHGLDAQLTLQGNIFHRLVGFDP
jgi:hypothetical protein